MIRKVINEDGTFGGNYSWTDIEVYKKAGVWPEESYIDLDEEKSEVINQNPDRYIYKADVPGIFYGDPMGVIEKPEYQAEQLEAARNSKYMEITDAYDYANKYYVLNVAESIYANTSWIETWSKVIDLCKANKMATVPSSVRYYSKLPSETKFKNVNVANVEVATLEKQLLMLKGVQFNVLQPKRAALYSALEKATTVEELDLIRVNFGTVINEQDQTDVASKMDLTAG